MKKVCLQVGHWQIENLSAKGLRSWRSTEVLRKSTGAGGERDYHWTQIMPRLRDKLIAKGIQVYITSGIWDDIYSSENFDLWLSLHYDGGGSQNRCMISAPTRDAVPAFLHDKAQREAERFCAIWKVVYPEVTGAINRDERITEGMLWYYAFDYVPMDTPAVIIEHFNHTSEKGKELKSNPELVAEADYKAILQFLGIPEEEPSTKYEVFFKGKKIKEYDYDITKKLTELEKDLKNKTTEWVKLGKDFEAYKLAKAKEISNLNISQIKYKTDTEKVITAKNGEILNLKTEVEGQKEIIKQLKATPTVEVVLKAYSGLDLIGLGIRKLLSRGKEVKPNGV